MYSYTEDINNLNSSLVYWFNADISESLFYLLENPISQDEYFSSLIGQLEVSSESVVYMLSDGQSAGHLCDTSWQDTHYDSADHGLLPDECER